MLSCDKPSSLGDSEAKQVAFFVSEEMKYHLSHLVAGSLGENTSVHVQEGTTTLDQDLTIDFLRGEILFTRVNRGIYAEGHLRTQVQANCARCLEHISYPLEFEITERFLFVPRKEDPEPVYLISGNAVIDISEPTRQQIWINLPIRLLCRPDCQGLCSQCGINLNKEVCSCQEQVIDPRLAPLKELL